MRLPLVIIRLPGTAMFRPAEWGLNFMMMVSWNIAFELPRMPPLNPKMEGRAPHPQGSATPSSPILKRSLAVLLRRHA